MAFAIAAGGHLAALGIYEATRPVIHPLVMIEVVGEGSGLVTSLPVGAHCGVQCQAQFPEGTELTLTATVGENATFEGWSDDCGPQSWRGFRWVLDVAGDDLDPLFADELTIAGARPASENPLECKLRVSGKRMTVAASFGIQPDEVEVKWVTLPDEPLEPAKVAAAQPMTVSLPDPSFEAENIIEPEMLPDEMEMEEIAQAEPIVPEPPPPVPPVTPPPPEKAPAQPKVVNAPKMKSVEVPDENEVEEAPDDATFLSDKNRDVAEETHADQTNLERANEGDRNFSEESDVKSDDIGAKEDEIAELEDTEASDLDSANADESTHNGKDEVAEGVLKGDEGEAGDDGEAGNDKPSDKPGVLAMRGIDGRGAPGGPLVEKDVEEGKGAQGDPGDGGSRGRRGKKGKRGFKRLDMDDYKRIVGKEKVEDEQKLAKRKVSKRRGRWEKKLGAIQQSLENFTPEVRPGNQTALKTRAAPFAVYIARMHRSIHKLWGFGFLEDLDDKSSSHAMNDWSLSSKIEVVINPDGSVDKLTIVKPSGVLPFDVAAMDTIYTGAPYPEPPSKIRSPDGKTYMHWHFHRDWRQCGTFGVQPFILAEAPQKDRDTGFSDGDMVKNRPRIRKKNRKKKREVGMPTGESAADNEDAAAATARATASMPTPDDPAAKHASNLWLTGFTKRRVEKMIKVSGVPFQIGDSQTAAQKSELKRIYKALISESRGSPRATKLYSPSQYRKQFGSLPGGFESDGTELLYVVRLRKDQFTLIVKQSGDGTYAITGLFR